MAQREIKIETGEQVLGLFGNFDANIKLIEKEYAVKVICRGNEIKIVGEDAQVENAERAIQSLLTLIASGENLDSQNIRYTLDLVDSHEESAIKKLTGDCICITAGGKPIKPKTVGQKEYTDAIENNTIVLGIGPAGTGKTYLAVAMAVKAFKEKKVNRI
ncbi:MAG: PhoH family protein, partial [Clostridia bacterium]|nr:PhoH family protein [Clostridia bacterium]